MARGVVLLAPAQRGLEVGEYAPNKVKKAVVGAGKASKEQVQLMVKQLLPGVDFDSADAADALAVAIAASNDAGKTAGITLGSAQSVPNNSLSKAISLALARDDAKYRGKT